MEIPEQQLRVKHKTKGYSSLLETIHSKTSKEIEHNEEKEPHESIRKLQDRGIEVANKLGSSSRSLLSKVLSLSLTNLPVTPSLTKTYFTIPPNNNTYLTTITITI